MNDLSDVILSVCNLKKAFNGHTVLDGITFELNRGDIMGVVGANGSGKTTLMNILYGSEVIRNTGGYEGQIFMEGQPVNISSTQDAIDNGLAMVHQEFALLPDMSVAENIKIGNEFTYGVTDRILPKKLSLIDTRRNNEHASRVLSELGINTDTTYLMKKVSTNIQQFSEIAREIDRDDIRVLILDEPTAVMNRMDSQKLLDTLRKLSETGIAILFISHRLQEIKDICNKVMILRDGKQISQYESDAICIEKIALDMIGQEITKVQKKERVKSTTPLLTFKDYCVDYPGDEVKGVDFDVYEGEILGITSLAGQGKLGVAKGIMENAPIKGSLIFRDMEILQLSYNEKIRQGIYVLCEDRKNTSLLMNHSVKDNIVFSADQIWDSFNAKGLGKWFGWLDKKAVVAHVKYYCEKFGIKMRSVDQLAWELSGGNQQKVCLARALSLNPQVLFVSEPTRGIDVAAKEKILESLTDINSTNNTTLVVASSELDELIRICDRIMVLYEGRISAVLDASADIELFSYALSGIQGEKHEKNQAI